MSAHLHEFQVMYVKIETAEILKPRNAFFKAVVGFKV